MSAQEVALSSVAEVFNGKTPSRDEQREQGHPVLKIRDIDEVGAFRGRFGSYVDHEMAAKYRSRFIQVGDTLILNAAHSATHVASKTCFATAEFAGSLATGEWLVIRPNHHAVDPRFVNQWVNWSRTRRQLREVVNGIHLYPKDVERLTMPKLERRDQARIADILDKADAIRCKRQQALRLTDDFLRSVFLNMFGDPVTNPNEWPTKQLLELGRVSTGSTPPSSSAGMFGGAIPFITPGDLKETWTDSARTVTEEGARNARTVRAGATLVCCIGATIGKMGKAKILSAFNQQINAVEWNSSVVDDYGLDTLKFYKQIIASRGSSTTLPILNKSAFQSLEIPVAPIEMQQAYSKIVRQCEATKNQAVQAQSEAEDLFASIQQRAFSGQL